MSVHENVPAYEEAGECLGMMSQHFKAFHNMSKTQFGLKMNTFHSTVIGLPEEELAQTQASICDAWSSECFKVV